MARFSLVLRAIHRLFSSFWPRVENSVLSSRYLASFSMAGGGGQQGGDPVSKQPHKTAKAAEGGKESSRGQGDPPRKTGSTFRFPATPIPKAAPVKEDLSVTGAATQRHKQQIVPTVSVTQSRTNMSGENEPPHGEASQPPQLGKPTQVRVDPFRFRFNFSPRFDLDPTPTPTPTMSETVSKTLPSHDAPTATKPPLSNLSGSSERPPTPIVTQHKITSSNSAIPGLVSDESSLQDVTSQNASTSESTRPVFGSPYTPPDIMKKLSTEAEEPRPVFGRPPTPVAESKETASTPRPVFGRPPTDKSEKLMSSDAEIPKPIFIETHKPNTTVNNTSGDSGKPQKPSMTFRFTVTPQPRPQGSQAQPKQTPKESSNLSPPESTRAASPSIFFTRPSISVLGAHPAESAKSEPKASSRPSAAPPVTSKAGQASAMSPSETQHSVQDKGQFSDNLPIHEAQQSGSSAPAPLQQPTTPYPCSGGKLHLTNDTILSPSTSSKTTSTFKRKVPPKGPQAPPSPPSPAPPKSPRTRLTRVLPDPPFLATPHLQEHAKLEEQKAVLRSKFRAAVNHLGGDMQEALDLAEKQASKSSWSRLMPKEPQVRDPPKDAPGQKLPPKEAPGDGNSPAMKTDAKCIDPPGRVPPSPPRQPVASSGWYHVPEYFEHQPTTFYDMEVEISKKRRPGTPGPDKGKGKGYKRS